MYIQFGPVCWILALYQFCFSVQLLLIAFVYHYIVYYQECQYPGHFARAYGFWSKNERRCPKKPNNKGFHLLAYTFFAYFAETQV